MRCTYFLSYVFTATPRSLEYFSSLKANAFLIFFSFKFKWIFRKLKWKPICSPSYSFIDFIDFRYENLYIFSNVVQPEISIGNSSIQVSLVHSVWFQLGILNECHVKIQILSFLKRAWIWNGRKYGKNSGILYKMKASSYKSKWEKRF